MVHAPQAPEGTARGGLLGDFRFTLKGWRSQLRWAMTQREDDPARVWLEVISIDERSKRALSLTADPEQADELRTFRAKLESSMASLTEELGDENVAPLYAWLDLVRERRKLAARIEEAKQAVVQARAARDPERARAPSSEQAAIEQLARAQSDLEQWKGATPPAPPPEVVAVWEDKGGDLLRATMSQEPIVAGRRGDRARRLLSCARGRAPGKHPWQGSRAERISIPAAAGVVLFATLLGFGLDLVALRWTAVAAALTLAALVTSGALLRRRGRAEIGAALDWAWHSIMYEDRARIAELEAGWLRALVDAQRALKASDAKAGTGGQLRDFEKARPDLAAIVEEVARDTEGAP